MQSAKINEKMEKIFLAFQIIACEFVVVNYRYDYKNTGSLESTC